MKRFLSQIGLFSSPIIALAIVLEILLRGIPNDYRLKRAYLDANASAIETLILGSSHSFYGLDPAYFSSNTFNASHISQSLSYDYAILNRYKDELVNLKTLVIPISYFTLFETLESSSEAWRNKNYAIYYDISLVPSAWEHSEVLRNRLDVSIERLNKYYIEKQPSLTATNLGWGMNYDSNSEIDLEISGRNTAKKHTVVLDDEEVLKIIQQNKKTLEAIQAWCVAQDITLLLFTPPAHPSYTKNLSPEQLHISTKYLEAICNESSNCQYKPLLDSEVFITEDFYDPDHLSHSGAKKLSRLINESLVK